MGIVGLALLVFARAAIHVRIFGALRTRRTPRIFLHLVVIAGLLKLMVGFTATSRDLTSAVWLNALRPGAA